MPLIPCPDCGREVSDRAPACIGCGAPIRSRAAASGASPGANDADAARRGFKVLALVAALVLIGIAANIRPAAVKPEPIVAAPPPKTWRVIGSQGAVHFVQIDREHANDQAAYRFAIADLCGVPDICHVLFWVEGDNVPQRLPLTEAQIFTKAAHWTYNGNTGLRRMLWNCRRFPETPKAECL